MSADGFQLRFNDTTPPLHVHRWLPDGAAPRAALLIVHGMAEHGGRYGRFAAAANAAGIAVHALDLPGHGLSAAAAERGHFADHDGWALALSAIHGLRLHIDSAYPGLPSFALGHSMGSFLMQDYLVEFGGDRGKGLAGAVLSATSNTLGPLRAVGGLLMRAEALLLGPRHPSALAEALSFKAFNKAFEPARTGFDWLSRDAAEVDAYIADPSCGFRCSARLWADLFAAGAGFGAPDRLARVPADLPIRLICGSADPVSQGEQGPTRLAAAYRAAGVREVSVRAWQDGRHELLNDICRDEVTTDLLGWIEARLASG